MATDLQRAIEAARARGAEPSRSVTAESVAAIRGTAQRRARTRVSIVSGVAAIGIVVAAVSLWPRSATPHESRIAGADREQPWRSEGAEVHFADGSIATPLVPDTAVEALSVSATRVQVGLVRGRARFDVVHMPSREFQVEVGRLRVVVLGTSFTITRSDSAMIVDVHRGHVRVDGDDEARHLYGGQLAEFALAPHANEEMAATAQDVTPAGSTARARVGQSDIEASRSPIAVSPQAVATLDEALDAADEARLQGDNERALQLLTEGLAAHPSDPQRQVALFTRARILGDALHRAREAAAGYAEARAASPNGSLAEDALAREIEALNSAGDIDGMRARREEYLQQFPLGVHRRAVERF